MSATRFIASGAKPPCPHCGSLIVCRKGFCDRCGYNAAHNQQPSPALRNTPSTASIALDQADGPAAGSAFIKFMYSLARRVLL
jgi:predicted amidophosphoribosyltransferase